MGTLCQKHDPNQSTGRPVCGRDHKLVALLGGHKTFPKWLQMLATGVPSPIQANLTSLTPKFSLNKLKIANDNLIIFSTNFNDSTNVSIHYEEQAERNAMHQPLSRTELARERTARWKIGQLSLSHVRFLSQNLVYSTSLQKPKKWFIYKWLDLAI